MIKIKICIIILCLSFFACTEKDAFVDTQPSLTTVLTTKTIVPIHSISTSIELYSLSPEEKVNNSLNDFPFSDDETLSNLKTIYDDIDFSSIFHKGNTDVYNYYKDKYIKMLNDEFAFLDKKSNEKFYVSEFGEFNSANLSGLFDLNNYLYYFFDMDGDDNPELCVSDNARFTYIYKYISKTNEFVLWHALHNGYLRLHGTRKIRYNRLGLQYEFYILDENGDTIEAVSFFNTYHTHEICMLYLPGYLNENKELEQIEPTEEMKNHGFYWGEDSNIYSFKVTKNQFDEITKEFFIAEEVAEENLNNIALTYEELLRGFID